MRPISDQLMTIRFDETQFGVLMSELIFLRRAVRMAKEEILAAVAAAKTAVAEMKASVTTDLEEIIRRLQANDPTAEVVAAVNDVIADIKGVDILPDFPAPPTP